MHRPRPLDARPVSGPGCRKANPQQPVSAGTRSQRTSARSSDPGFDGVVRMSMKSFVPSLLLFVALVVRATPTCAQFLPPLPPLPPPPIIPALDKMDPLVQMRYSSGMQWSQVIVRSQVPGAGFTSRSADSGGRRHARPHPPALRRRRRQTPPSGSRSSVLEPARSPDLDGPPHSCHG